MNNDPNTWVEVPLEEIAANAPASLTDGPFGSNLKTSHYTQKGPRVIRLQNIGDGLFVDESAHISEEHFALLRRHEAIAGDVVIAMLGDKLPRACMVPPHVGPAIVKADCVRLRVHLGLSTPSYIAHALNSQQLRRQAVALVHGVGRPRLGLKWLRTLRVPLAPYSEQHRIVEAIESYFTRLDDVVASLERVQCNLKRYRASVLKAAVEGRLVPTEAELARVEGRDYEPASVLLDRILAERRHRWEEAELAKIKAKDNAPKVGKWKVKYKEPVEPNARELPDVPEGWCWATVEQLLVEPLANGRSVRTAKKGFSVLRLTSLRNGTIDFGERKTGAWTAQDAARFLVEEGDFLVSRGNGSIRLVGLGGLVRSVPSPVAYPDTMIRVRLCHGIEPRFFAHVWNSREVRDQLEAKAKTTAGIFKINQDDLASCVFPLPPRQEQLRIQMEIERLISQSGAAGILTAQSGSRCDRLRQSILKWAFEGRLVDQDPTDEPASRLLERIRAERESADSMTPQSRGRRKARSSKA